MTDEQMREYEVLKKQKQNQLKRQNEYNKKHYERLNIVLPIGCKKRVEKAAKKSGFKSTNQYVKQLIYADFERLGWKTPNTDEKTAPQAPERPTEPRKEGAPSS